MVRSFLLFILALWGSAGGLMPRAAWSQVQMERAQGSQPLTGRAQTTTLLPQKLQARNFGVVGDGVTDDGPAVLRLMDAAARAGGPVTVQFEPRRSYFLKTGRDGYAFSLDNARDLVLDGGDSLFLVDGARRFLKIARSRNVLVRGFKVDYVPLPFADGVVVGKDKTRGTLDVQIDADQELPPAVSAAQTGGLSPAVGEAAFYGALWAPGAYSTQGQGGDYWVRSNFTLQSVGKASANRVVRLETYPGEPALDGVEVGKWRCSVPVRGLAHRVGPGETCLLTENGNLTLENIEVWSAPWVAFGLKGNRGNVTLRNVNVRPKPGTTRTTSAWHDAFHAGNNRAILRWENCTVQGNGEEAFDIATRTSTVFAALSPTRVQLSQNYPLGVASMEVGDALSFYNPVQGRLLGRAKIVKVDPANFVGEKSPLFTLDLDTPIAGLVRGTSLAWNETSGNPHNVLYRCRLDTSSHFRAPTLLETCQVNALAVFNGDEIEAPLPSNTRIVDCQFRLGQGSSSQVLVMGGMYLEGHGPNQTVLSNVMFDHNQVWGGVTLNDIKGLTITDNIFADARRMVSLSNVEDVIFRGNSHAGLPIQNTGDMMGHADF